MNLGIHIKQPFNGTIWRMETDAVTDTLFLEIRYEQDKQVSFTSIDLQSGKTNFTDLKTEERWLTGIEAGYNGVLLLHNYETAGSPAHKGLIALEGKTGQQLWSDYNRTFNHLSTNGPVVFDNRLQPRRLFTIDVKTGDTLHTYAKEVDNDLDTGIVLPEIVNDVSGFNLPETPFGNIAHYLCYNNFRIVSLHTQKNGQLNQSLYVLKQDKLVFNDLLNTAIQKLQPEAFVLHHHYLIYLKNRNELNVINLKTE